MASLRAFLAALPDAPAREAIAQLSQSLRTALAGEDIRWMGPFHHHLTLLFLGQVDETAIPALQGCLQPVLARHAAFALCWERVEWFPDVRHPRVLAWLPEHSDALMALQQDMHDAVAVAGFHLEQRPYRPHLSLARVRGPMPALPAVPVTAHAMPVNAVHLMRSDHTPRGVQYTPCFSLPLPQPGC